jgi:hypothetical protein
MAQFVQYDADGNIAAQEPARRGRTPKNWTRVNDDLTPIEPKPDGKIVRPSKAPVLTSLLVQFDDGHNLVTDDDGDMVTQVAKKGRTPAGWTRVRTDEFGELYDMDGNSLETGEPCADVAKEPQETLVKETNEEPVVAKVIPATILDQTQEFTATSQRTLAEFQEHIDASRIQDEDDTIKMEACTIETDPKTDYLKVGMAISRIDLGKHDGDISIWREKPKGNPTVIIRGALEPENVL